MLLATPKPHTSTASPELKDSLVTPDTCMDIIFNINISDNKKIKEVILWKSLRKHR
jgi:hypothetical protein